MFRRLSLEPLIRRLFGNKESTSIALEGPTCKSRPFFYARSHLSGARLHPTKRAASIRRQPFLLGAVGDYFARSLYVPSAVLTTIFSPFSMKSGTRISAPVSTVAGFRVLVAVLPFMPGSV